MTIGSKIDQLLGRARKAYDVLTDGEKQDLHEAQRQSFVRGQLSMGNDKQEEAYKLGMRDRAIGFNSNPYLPADPRHKFWDDGYHGR